MDSNEKLCPTCGANQADLDEWSFEEKLIRALRHPEPETPVRAAYILGQLRVHEAVPVLLELGRQSEDICIAAAAIDALGEIGDSSIIGEVEAISQMRREAVVRLATERASRKLTAAKHSVQG